MSDDDRLAEGVAVDRAIPFRETPSRELLLDAYPPSEPTEAGLVFLHGGGWQGGGRDDLARQAAFLADEGYLSAVAEYRFSDEATFPAAVADAAAAVEWVREQGAERVGVFGGSAGGHLAAMLATAPGVVDADRVDAAVLCNATLNVVPEDGTTSENRRKYLGDPYAAAPERYELASPVRHVDESTPPVLVCNGTEDVVTPMADAETFCERVREAGGRADLFRAEGAPHAFFHRTPWYEQTLFAAAAFLREVLPTGSGTE